VGTHPKIRQGYSRSPRPACYASLITSFKTREFTRYDKVRKVSAYSSLARKYPTAAKEWGWQYVFPARDLSVDPRSGVTRRHHIDPSVINKATKVAVRRADSRSTSAHIPFGGTPSPHTYSNAALRFAPFSNCSDTVIWPRPWSIPTSFNRAVRGCRVPWTISAF